MKIISIPEVRDIHQARAKRRELLTRMADLEQRVANGDTACRPLLEADRETVAALEAFIEHEQERREARDRAESAGTGGSDPYEPPPADGRTMPIAGGRAGGLWRALQQGGWDLRSNPGVTVLLREALPPSFPDPATYSPRPAGDIVPMPADSRYLWSVFPSADIGMDTSVQDFRQTAREVTGTVERDLDATTDKATLSVGIEHVVAEVRQFAVVLKDVPTAVLESLPTAQRFFETEARRALNQAIDQHCYNAIINANPPSGDTGADLIQQVRHGVAAMRSNGANPTVLALNPADAVALDLAQQPSGDGDGDYIFPTRATGSASPLWGLTVFESPIVTDPLLIDPQMIGQLYLGSLAVLADPYSKLAQNLVDIRFELRALLHVRSAFGAYVIAGAGA
ncbi:DUF4200 domain-containing protein [Sphaerobacter thermophilus]|uniref:Phage major capsid protein, HK97 family n=1 Tax=Sphaerobacter thermophilus (strain ATCC 49802 / DSM 20745 / KCCM 41009 / NCIMB 13125 / S 6022) TaxID=479434 RepID=D1C6R2_SPHTD|nr:DUF4200 domain-containing protein [Sphaerobacter thermophilus]ACZ39687.1 hypothetical protein Sthe_2266 [Sphaerobacter thermophilus DSM 20745]